MTERNDHIDNERLKARVIAMYLPQFHRTEVNDRYWGDRKSTRLNSSH